MLQATNKPAEAVTQDARLERSILSAQLQELESTRRALQKQMEAAKPATPQRAVIADQIADVSRRIAVVDNMIARTQAQLQSPELVATTVQPPPDPGLLQPTGDTFKYLGLFSLILLLPMSIAMTRRIWRRSSPVQAALPLVLDERLARIEQTVDAMSIEVERIGEGQRFVTKLLTETEPARLTADS